MPVSEILNDMPVILIQTQKPENSFIFSAKPFSTKGLRKFVRLLKSKGITVNTEKFLHLE